MFEDNYPPVGGANLHIQNKFYFLFEILKKCRFQRYITLNVEVDS